MDQTNVGMSLRAGRFLGSKDRILVCGNSFNGNSGSGGGGGGQGTSNKTCSTKLQILFSKFINEVDGPTAFVQSSELVLNDRVVDMEICGVPRLAKTFAVVTKTNTLTSKGSISLVDIETGIDSSSLTGIKEDSSSSSANTSTSTSTSISTKDSMKMFQSFCPYSAVTFNSELELLAAANEAGEVIIWDMYGQKELSRIRADAAGVNKLKFLKTGQLVTVGNSVDCQIKIWDLKFNTSTPAAVFSQGLSKYYKSTSTYANSKRRTPRYTSLMCHSIQDKIAAGTNAGSIVVWDVRSGGHVEYQVHTSAITDTVMHPRSADHVLSCSTDGTVSSMSMSGHGMSMGMGLGLGLGLTDMGSGVKTYISDSAAFTSLDYDLDSSMILAIGSLGGVYRMQL